MTDKLASLANWPTVSQVELLHATLANGDRALQAWRTWSASNDIQVLDNGSFHVLPQLYLNLLQQGFDAESMNILKGIHRQSWSRNQLALRDLADVAQSLDQARIQHVVVNGLPLAMFYYDDPGARVIFEARVLIRAADFQSATAVLRRSGWDMPHAVPPDRLVASLPAVQFRRANSSPLTLSFQMLPGQLPQRYEEAIMQRAVRREFRQVEFSVPDQLDMLLLTCLYARSGDPQSQCGWIMDAKNLLKKEASIDWDELLHRAQDCDHFLAVRDALTYLHRICAALVPDKVIERAWSVHCSAHDEQRYLRLTQDRVNKSVFRAVSNLWLRYLGARQSPGKPRDIPGFFSYFTSYCRWRLHIQHGWQLPFRLIQEAAHRIRFSQ